MESTRHPLNPESNIRKVGVYDPNKYFLGLVSQTILTHEDLTPGKPPYITQYSIGKYLKPGTRELDEVPPRPTVNEFPDAVIENMVKRDKAFWVDKPGANAYTLHDAYYNYEMTTVMVKPPHQDVFPRSYQYDLDCIKYRHRHAKDAKENQKRWKNYPDFSAPPSLEETKKSMGGVGSPFKNEACNWYYKNYPPVTYNTIMRKFSK